jgi:hypothetical protein
MSIFMNPVLQAVEAARLLGRWTLIAERHAGGCPCCPGLGAVSTGEVEERLLAWLRPRHQAIGERASLPRLLKDCIERKADIDPQLLADIDGALADLESIQAGY